MDRRGGTRRGAAGLGALDAIAIVFVILILSCSLGALLAGRDARFANQTRQWLRVAIDHLSPSVLLPNQAAAEGEPSTRTAK